MRALLSKAPGGPETLVLEDVPEPQARRGQVRIAVRACGVNFPDVLVIQDLYQFKPPRPFAPGCEIAGVVDAVGEGVTSLKVGDRVIGWARSGGMAEKMVLFESSVFPICDAMPFDAAAAFLMTYGTSQHALKDRAALKPGETLLVLGAAGGVGIAAVELGKAYGAHVVAAVSSEEKAAFAREHGADATVVYPTGPLDRDAQKALSEQYKQACGEGGADVILDPVGGDYAEPALRSIGWEGRYLVVGFPAGIPKIPLNLTLLKGCQIVGVFWGEFIRREPVRHAANVTELLGLYDAGKLRPVVSATYPLERGGDAIAHLASRKAVGKVVVTI